MENTNEISASKQRVLIFAAQTPRVRNRQIYFLFSQHQMEDILMDVSVQPVPLSPAYAEGVAEWRNRALPVISLETCLGMEPLITKKTQRLMVIRTPKSEGGSTEAYHIMVRVVPPIQMLTLPIACAPVSDDWIPQKPLVRAVYEWQEGLLVVAHMAGILHGRSRAPFSD